MAAATAPRSPPPRIDNIDFTTALTEPVSTDKTLGKKRVAAFVRHCLYGWVAKLSQILRKFAYIPRFHKTVVAIDQRPRLNALA